MSMQQLTEAQNNPEIPINENFETLEHQSVYGKDHRETSSLIWGYYGGRWGGNAVSDGTVNLTGSSTNYLVVLRSTGVLSSSTTNTNWNDTTDYARVYKITTSASAVTATEDHRAGPYGVHGQSTPGGGVVAAEDVTIVDAGTYFTGTDVEAALQELGADVAAISGLTDGDKGDITVSGTGATWTVDNNVVTYAKMQDVSATSRVLGRKTAGSGDPEECTLSDILDFIGSAAQGDILYRGASAWARLAAGTSGQFLKTQGAGANPVWDTPSGSGTTGKHAIYIPAAAMRPSATGGCAALAAVATSANQPDLLTLDFDTSTEEYAQFTWAFPKSWNEGTITFRAHWSHASTTTNFGVAWKLQAVAVSDDDAIATSYGTAVAVTDTGGTTNDLYITSESSSITVGGSPAAEDMVFFRVFREPSNGSDTMAIDARLHGITVYFTTDAETDA